MHRTTPRFYHWSARVGISHRALAVDDGHVLGFAHSTVTGATMYPSVSACNNGPASIEADDKAGINDLY